MIKSSHIHSVEINAMEITCTWDAEERETTDQ